MSVADAGTTDVDASTARFATMWRVMATLSAPSRFSSSLQFWAMTIPLRLLPAMSRQVSTIPTHQAAPSSSQQASRSARSKGSTAAPQFHWGFALNSRRWRRGEGGRSGGECPSGPPERRAVAGGGAGSVAAVRYLPAFQPRLWDSDGSREPPEFWGFGWSCRLVTSAGAEEMLAGFRGSEGYTRVTGPWGEDSGDWVQGQTRNHSRALPIVLATPPPAFGPRAAARSSVSASRRRARC